MAKQYANVHIGLVHIGLVLSETKTTIKRRVIVKYQIDQLDLKRIPKTLGKLVLIQASDSTCFHHHHHHHHVEPVIFLKDLVIQNAIGQPSRGNRRTSLTDGYGRSTHVQDQAVMSDLRRKGLNSGVILC